MSDEHEEELAILDRLLGEATRRVAVLEGEARQRERHVEWLQQEMDRQLRANDLLRKRLEEAQDRLVELEGEPLSDIRWVPQGSVEVPPLTRERLEQMMRRVQEGGGR